MVGFHEMRLEVSILSTFSCRMFGFHNLKTHLSTKPKYMNFSNRTKIISFTKIMWQNVKGFRAKYLLFIFNY